MVTAGRIIVLNTTKVGDRNLVVHALGSRSGRRSYIVSVGKAGASARFQPLNILDVEVVENPKSDLWRLRGVSPVYPLVSLRSDMYKSAISMFMAEVLFRCIRDGAEPGLFEWCEKSILTLDSLPGSYANYHLRWLLELCSALGFTPSLQDMAPFAGEHLHDMEALMGPYGESLTVPLDGRSRSAIAESILEYLSSHLEYHLAIRSLPILAELFR